MRKKPTTQQQKFIDEFMKDFKAAPAAERAGYSYWSADVIMENPVVKAEIDRRMKIVEDMANVSAAFVLTQLREVADRCMQAVPVMVFNHETKEMEPTGEWKFDSMGANKALELLGKKLKLWTDKVEHTVGEDFWQALDRADEERRKAQGK